MNNKYFGFNDDDLIFLFGKNKNKAMKSLEALFKTHPEYTEEELAAKRHNFELQKCESNVICVDSQMAGVGSNSCGPALAEKYRLSLPNISAKLHMEILG